MNKVSGKGQVTIPHGLRKQARIETGDLVAFELVEEGILIRPQRAIDASQAWFWTSEWQEGERRASEDIRAGRVRTYTTGEDFLASLDE